MSLSLSLLEDSLEERNSGERVNAYGSIVADNEAMEEDEAVEIEEVCVLSARVFFDRSLRIIFIFSCLLLIRWNRSIS